MPPARNAGAAAVLIDLHGTVPICGEDRRTRFLGELPLQSTNIAGRP